LSLGRAASIRTCSVARKEERSGSFRSVTILNFVARKRRSSVRLVGGGARNDFSARVHVLMILAAHEGPDKNEQCPHQHPREHQARKPEWSSRYIRENRVFWSGVFRQGLHHGGCTDCGC